MTRKACFAALLLGCLAALPAAAGTPIIEPRLMLPRGGTHGAPQVALTLDACSGKTDQRIIRTLVQNDIPSTIFVTARWLKTNGETVKLMLSRPDLFQIENHGARHIPAVDIPVKVYGIAAAGSPEAVRAEVEGGRMAIEAATGITTKWFRGATARYDASAMAEIRAMGQAIAGYSLRADDGATLPAAQVVTRLAAAKDGDVIIAHVNHPEKSSGAGVAEGILALKAKGYVFVKLGPPPKPAAHAS